MKTIFIIASRGFLVRNILRSGVLKHLKDAGFRVVVFLATNSGKEIPAHLKNEFEDNQVVLEIAPNVHLRGYSRFSNLGTFVVWSRSRRHYSKIGAVTGRNLNRAFFWKYIDYALLFTFGNIHFFKTFLRFIEKNFFTHNAYAHYFDMYKPSLVFSTSVQTLLDIDMMKEAQKKGIPTVAIPKGWDNITKVFYRFVPDLLIVQDEPMKKEAARIQRIEPHKIQVTGFPQFDWYRKPEILVSREEFCAWYNLDPNKKIIFFGSEGIWAPDDENIISLLAEWVNAQNVLSKPSQLFIRPHYTDMKSGRFVKFQGIKNVIVDNNITVSDFFGDNWDPGVEETKKFTNLIHHCDVMITVASTLNLDAACFDKPIINVAFNVLHHPRTGKDLSPILYTEDHCYWFLETGAVDLVHDVTELNESINAYLFDPNRKARERKILLEKLCYKVDGKSSERVARILIQIANKEHDAKSAKSMRKPQNT